MEIVRVGLCFVNGIQAAGILICERSGILDSPPFGYRFCLTCLSIMRLPTRYAVIHDNFNWRRVQSWHSHANCFVQLEVRLRSIDFSHCSTNIYYDIAMHACLRSREDYSIVYPRYYNASRGIRLLGTFHSGQPLLQSHFTYCKLLFGLGGPLISPQQRAVGSFQRTKSTYYLVLLLGRVVIRELRV